jgi:hypothetical protein
MALGPEIFLLLLLCALTALNVWRGAETEGGDGLRDALSIMQGVLIGLIIAAALGAMVFVEWSPPPPSRQSVTPISDARVSKRAMPPSRHRSENNDRHSPPLHASGEGRKRCPPFGRGGEADACVASPANG